MYVLDKSYTILIPYVNFFRLSYTFRLVPNFHWIIVEDSEKPTKLVTNLLRTSMLNYTHLIAPTPASWKRKLRVIFQNTHILFIKPFE